MNSRFFAGTNTAKSPSGSRDGAERLSLHGNSGSQLAPWNSAFPLSDFQPKDLTPIDFGRQARIAPDLLADEEERRGGAGPLQGIQHRGRAVGVGTVVERERDSGALAPARHAERGRNRRHMAGQRRGAPHGGGCGGEREG